MSVRTKVSWFTAKMNCERENRTLAIILDERTNDFLKGLIEDENVFVGGFYEQGSWKWIDNETFQDYNNWEEDHPKTKAKEGSNLQMIYDIEDSKWGPTSPG